MHINEGGFTLKFSVECFITCKDKLLLFKRSSTAKNFPGFWSIPGGHLDVDEDVLTACIREVKEETGTTVDSNKVKLKYIAHHKHIDRNEIWNVFGFKVEIPTLPKIINSEEGVSDWFEISQLDIVDIFPPVKIHITHALDENSGILYTSAELKNLEVVKTNTLNIDKDH